MLVPVIYNLLKDNANDSYYTMTNICKIFETQFKDMWPVYNRMYKSSQDDTYVAGELLVIYKI